MWRKVGKYTNFLPSCFSLPKPCPACRQTWPCNWELENFVILRSFRGCLSRPLPWHDYKELDYHWPKMTWSGFSTEVQLYQSCSKSQKHQLGVKLPAIFVLSNSKLHVRRDRFEEIYRRTTPELHSKHFPVSFSSFLLHFPVFRSIRETKVNKLHLVMEIKSCQNIWSQKPQERRKNRKEKETIRASETFSKCAHKANDAEKRVVSTIFHLS